MGQVVPLYLPVDDEPQFPRIPLVDDGPAHPTLAHLKATRSNPLLEVVLRSMVVSFLGQLGCVGTRYRESVDLGMNRDDESLYQTIERDEG